VLLVDHRSSTGIEGQKKGLREEGFCERRLPEQD